MRSWRAAASGRASSTIWLTSRRAAGSRFRRACRDPGGGAAGLRSKRGMLPRPRGPARVARRLLRLDGAHLVDADEALLEALARDAQVDLPDADALVAAELA